MYGAILGDMIGAPYEFDRGNKAKEFPLFIDESRFTDDSVMTIAVAEALLDALEPSAGSMKLADAAENADDAKTADTVRTVDAVESADAVEATDAIKTAVVNSMRCWGRKYPDAGYGGRFIWWLQLKPEPYGSYGNGSAMRVSSAGWLFDDIERTREVARNTAEVTHNHPEGVKGAEAVASAVFLARTGRTKKEMKEYIIREFEYDLSRTCDEIRPSYAHNESCQKTVPEAITAFLEGTDFEDVIRTAVSLGGDCDTLTCIAGSIAEAFYEVPDEMISECRRRLPEDMLAVLDRFDEAIGRGRKPGDSMRKQ